MPHQVRLDPIAKTELLDAFDYLESQRPGLAKRFSQLFRAATEEISAHPARFPVFTGPYHRYRIDPFQYAIIYRLDETGTVFIASVFHLMRDQGRLKRRLTP